ncbi:hypothetical protein NMY22_g19677 [Coprinellus aureogranulatus]|nr:hypothetical protein NMY22_g19677 [Coprinellus aureogranulatus]
MIRVGLLQVFVDHLLSQSESEPYPWFAWVFHEPVNHPFNIVNFLCVHLPIFKATQAALKKIPKSKLKVLENGWYARHWTPWLKTFRLYEHIWDNHLKNVGTKMVSLCHNLNHHYKKNITAPFQAKECSNCRLAVYCSTDCQKEDWDTFHKRECAHNRCYRIDRALASSWPPHHHRAFFLSLLHRGVLNWEVGVPADSILPVTSPVHSTPVLEYPHAPFTEAHKSKVERSKNLVMQWNTLYSPPKVIFNSLSALLKFTHGGVPVYRDPRWLEMYRDLLASTNGVTSRTAGGRPAIQDKRSRRPKQIEDREGRGQTRMRLALCVAFDGLYWIYVMGRFAIINEERKTRVELLNGYMKVEERDKIDEGMVSDIIE